ncbi:MAG: response regulator [Deltaproteobacteria bacterium]|nr:response regulator [Deltaproteobacteria bacterium]
MQERKEPLEIECTHCGMRFRIWIPKQVSQQWGAGKELSCMQCRASFIIKKGPDGFSVQPSASKGVSLETIPGKIPVSERRGETILIVDGDALSRQMAMDSLKEFGLNTVEAKDAQAAFEILKREDVKAIVVDLYLKNPKDPKSTMEGEEFLQKVVDIGKTIPAIVITGRDLINELELNPKWFDLRVKGFVQKGNPSWPEELKVKVREVLKT